MMRRTASEPGIKEPRMSLDDSDKPTEDDFCSFADPKDLTWMLKPAAVRLRENEKIEAVRADLLKRMKKLEEKDND